MLREGSDQMFYNPAAASIFFEMTSASVSCVLLFSCRLCVAALTPARHFMYISARCHTSQAAACPILLSTFKASLAPQLHEAEHHVLSAVGDAAGDWRKPGTTGQDGRPGRAGCRLPHRHVCPGTYLPLPLTSIDSSDALS